ncbi:MAG: hypothetical protein ABI586_03585 [Candidatus Nanopelagicales bacterium]
MSWKLPQLVMVLGALVVSATGPEGAQISQRPGLAAARVLWGQSFGNMATANSTQEPADVVLTSQATAVCTAEQVTRWDSARTQSLGVIGQDPVGSRIGPSPAIKGGPIGPFAGQNWYPLDGYKHTLCGRLDRFKIYDGDWYEEAAEMDWNNFIVPSDAYGYILEDARAIADPGELQDCPKDSNNRNCLEAEITPDEHLYHNVFFDRRNPPPNTYLDWVTYSPLTGTDLCTYGPWIREEVHGDRPEIHPSELFWWRQPGIQGEESFFLMLLQDDSNRFDRNDNFTVNANPPAWWHPWSQVPRAAEFFVAFDATTSTRLSTNANTFEPQRFDIWDLYQRNVVTERFPEHYADADDGTEHAIQFDGTTLLRVFEHQPDDAVGVQFVDLCRLEGISRSGLIGFIRLRGVVGETDRGGEGYLVLQMDRRVEPSANIATTPVAVSVARPVIPGSPPNWRASFVNGSLRRAATAAGSTLVADISVSTDGPQAPAGTLVRAEGLIRGSRIPLSVRRDSSTVLAVPVGGQRALAVELSGGNTVQLPLSSVGLSAAAKSSAPQGPQAPSSELPAFLNASGIRDGVTAGRPRLVRYPKWELTLGPFYSGMRDGAVALEEQTPASAQLNAAIAGDADRRRSLFGPSSTFRIAWTVSALRADEGRPLQVENGSGPHATAVRIDTTRDRDSNSTLQVWFPTGPGIVKVVAIAKIQDTNGLEGETRFVLWSHALSAASADALLDEMRDVVAALAGVPSQVLRSAHQSMYGAARSSDTEEKDAVSRLVRMVVLLNAQLVLDGRIVPDELAKLARLAARLKSH